MEATLFFAHSAPIQSPLPIVFAESLLGRCGNGNAQCLDSTRSRVQLSRAGMDFGDLHLNLDGIEDGPGICRQGRPPTPPFYSFDLLTVLSENMCVMLCPEQSRTLGQ